jgi:hypothetical protein
LRAAIRWQQSNNQSGNPSGRPKGIVDKRMKVTKALADDAPAVARVVLDAALEGDMQAANIVLSRIAPPIKAQAERVQFELSPDLSLAQQAQQVMQAVADGLVDPETGKTLIACLQSVAGIAAVEALESRVVLLEARPVT